MELGEPFNLSEYTQLHIKWITKENLLYSRGNSTLLCGELIGKEIENSGYMYTDD